MARSWKLPSLPALPVDAWQPERASTTSSAPPKSAPVRKRALPRFDAEEEPTITGHFDLKDPRLFRSDRPPPLDPQELEESEATVVDGPRFEPLTPPGQAFDDLDTDEEPLTTIYAPQRGAPGDLLPLFNADFEPTRVDSSPIHPPTALDHDTTTRSRRRPRVTGLRVVLAIYVLALLAQTLALVLGPDELAAALFSLWHRWFG